MFKYILFLLVLVSVPAYAQVGQTTDGTHANITVGGNMTNTGNATLTADAEVTTQQGRWQGDYTANVNYQQSKHVKTIEMYGFEAKRNYILNDRNYVVGDVRYDYNDFRPWKNTGIAAAGWGYKLIRSKNFKVSNEFTVGARQTDDGTYAVARNSLWIRYNKGPITVYNKFLYEKSNIDYYRNQTGISYNLSKTFAVGIQNLYTKDVKENNITSMTLGFQF
jgi:putative salt-induced outer membrane protein YdiY